MATVSVRTNDLAQFGAFTWGFRGEIAVVRRAIELARSGSPALRDAAVAFAEHERDRGVSRETLTRRWRTLAALARAISTLWPKRPPLAIGSPPETDTRARVPLLASLVARGAWRDAVIVGLVAETSLSCEQIVSLRVHELAHFGGSDDLSRARAELARGRHSRSWALLGRGGNKLDRKSVDRVCERHGSSVAALRREFRGAA